MFQWLVAVADRLWQTAAFKFVFLKTYSHSKAQFYPTRQFEHEIDFRHDISAGFWSTIAGNMNPPEPF